MPGFSEQPPRHRSRLLSRVRPAEIDPYARCLRRRLAAQRTNLNAISTVVRFDFAVQLLLCTSLAARDIGQIAGYADASAFSRAHLRWTGQTPDRWRVRSPSDL